MLPSTAARGQFNAPTEHDRLPVDEVEAATQGGLVGSLIEVIAVPEAVYPAFGPAWEFDTTEDAIDINGMRGVCLAFHMERQQYLVQTFDGGLFALKASQMKEYTPAFASEAGGFDVVWPSHDTTNAAFYNIVGESLQTKGHCVVQMFTTARSRKSAGEEANSGSQDFLDFYVEEEATKLGRNNTTGVLELKTLEEEFVDTDRPSVDAFNRELSMTLAGLSEVLPSMLNLNIWGRTDGWLRVPKKSSKDSTNSEMRHMKDSEEYRQFLTWMNSRTVCMLYVIDCQGGELVLFPRTGGQESDLQRDTSRILLRRGQLIIFRNDLYDYSYQPEGDNVAIQTWLMTPPTSVKFLELEKAPRRDLPMLHVMSVMERFPVGCFGAEKSWGMFLAGTDAETPVPFQRMDFAPHYEDKKDAAHRGKAYINHGSFMDHEHVFGFNSEFWNLEYDVAVKLGVHQRWVLETGYECLHKAGYRREELNGQRIGVGIGDYSFEEWGPYTPEHKYKLVDDKFSYTTHVLSYFLGLNGPTVHVDTACSASLVAANALCNMMIEGEYGSQQQLKSALAMGVLAMLTPIGWLVECAGTMLSYRGRCFTFDQSADGFIRGEGCASANIQMGSPHEEASFDEAGRLAVVRATACNQDGRSASLTAPSGPSQQACIRASLRMGNVDPLEVLVAECHGTGTALGDPIEVGANKAIFGGPSRHELNHVLVTAKAHIGHTESTAGMCGFIKAALILLHATVSPNPHGFAVNSHLDIQGYPVILNTEQLDTGHDSTHAGISSFGFGGTNTRGDLWARCQKGFRKGGSATLLEPGEALSFVQTAVTEGTVHSLKPPKLTAHF